MAFDSEAYNTINLILSFIVVFTHGIGINLLVKLCKKNAQKLMIINLSVAELINSLFRIVVIICHLLPERLMPKFRPPPSGGFPRGAPGNFTANSTGRPGGGMGGRPGGGMPPRPPMKDAQLTSHYFTMFSMTGMYFIVFLIMLALTIDRLLVVVLRSYYNKVCSYFNVKILLALIWVIGIIMLIAFPLAHHVHEYDHSYHFEYHIYLVTDVIFMVAAIVSYAGVFLFYRGHEVLVESNDNPEGDADTSDGKNTSSSTSGVRQWSIVRTLLDPYFYIPLLIIITYFFFVVLPHWIYIGEKYGEKSREMNPLFAMLTLLLIGYWSDALVYIFLLPDVRKLLWRWMQCKKTDADGNDGNPPPPVDSSVDTGI